MVNLKWHDAVAVAAAQFKTKKEREAGWPQTMTIEQVAALQRPYLHKTEPGYRTSVGKTKAIADAIFQACEKGSIEWSTETRQTHHQITRTVPGDIRYAKRNLYGERVITPRQELAWATKDVQVKAITAPAFAAWLAAQGEVPSDHIAAWFEAMAVAAEAPALSAAPAAPAAEAAAAAAAPETVTTHITNRRDLLTPLVVKAQNTCDDRYDTAAVFTVLKSWAEQKTPPAPLEGLTEDGKIQWRDSNDKLQALRRSALAKRLKSQQKSTKPPPVGEQLRRIK